jgi:hypothetical protein
MLLITNFYILLCRSRSRSIPGQHQLLRSSQRIQLQRQWDGRLSLFRTRTNENTMWWTKATSKRTTQIRVVTKAELQTKLRKLAGFIFTYIHSHFSVSPILKTSKDDPWSTHSITALSRTANESRTARNGTKSGDQKTIRSAKGVDSPDNKVSFRVYSIFPLFIENKTTEGRSQRPGRSCHEAHSTYWTNWRLRKAKEICIVANFLRLINWRALFTPYLCKRLFTVYNKFHWVGKE